ncbi:MAG: hypothetical protein M1829_001538 [Trizodia sp. TS-e1964]|nr:MAG: hypothetical protein M1829_001538 [Trizodia sp. TS-e1964]
MPKKRRNHAFTEPMNRTPALSTTRQASSPLSVNESLSQLRKSQNPVTKSKAAELTLVATSRTVHPSLRGILPVANTPPPPPRTNRSGRRSQAHGPPGPAAPRSWLESLNSALPGINYTPHGSTANQKPMIDELPGTQLPVKNSLVHHALKSMAENWDWHVHYDQFHLALLPFHLKSFLLAYIARYGAEDGIGLEGLRVLFLTSAELEGATGGEDLTHLELAGSLGRAVTLSQLTQFFKIEAPCPITTPLKIPSEADDDSALPEPATAFSPNHNVPLTWEEEFDSLGGVFAALPTTRFPNLKHLSLAYPSREVSWPKLLSFAPLRNITHLSLAHWPTPSNTPISDILPLSFRMRKPEDWEGECEILRRLSRATPALKWLDVSGCDDWLLALAISFFAFDGPRGGLFYQKLSGMDSFGGPEWNGSWKRVERVVAKSRHATHGIAHGYGDLPTIEALEVRRGEVTNCVSHQSVCNFVAQEVRLARQKKKGIYCRFIGDSGEVDLSK